ncbi:MAG: polymer-forming cytoskeletal protein [Halanaerobiales bacterium]
MKRMILIISLALMLVFCSTTIFATVKIEIGEMNLNNLTDYDMELYIGGLGSSQTPVRPGERQILPEFPEFKQPPMGLNNKGSETIDNWSSSTVIRNNTYYNNLMVKSTLEIDTRFGDVMLRVRNLNFDSSGKIIVRGNGKLFLFVENDLHLTGGSSINSGDRFDNLELYHSGNRITLEGGASGNNQYKFSGIIYTEAQGLTIRNGASVNGLVYAKRADIVIQSGKIETQMIYTRNGTVSINNGAKVRGTLVAGGDKLRISNGSTFDGTAGGIFAIDADVRIEQGTVIKGKIVADPDRVEIRNINNNQSDYWIVRPGEGDTGWNPGNSMIKKITVYSDDHDAYFYLFYWNNFYWERIYPSNTGNGRVVFNQTINSNRIIIKNSGRYSIDRIEIK